MDADRWQRISDALAAALEATTGERERLLGALDGPDRDEVRQLLACGLRNPGFLSEPASVIAARQLAEEDACLRLGPWQLREQIGKGGMAVVYRAERDDGHFRKSAAAKILRFGIHGEDVRQRFQRERQVLAELSHPNIVRLWDGGVTPDGRPYLVEDFVDGPPVTEWAKARNLDLESRLRLFLAVCDAVAYAHERGVIHRDIKPGNILTTSEGVPILVDFGIAGLIQRGLPEPGATQTLARYWTPEYASPEQARGEAAGRRSDVYSLSMVLYELLLERRPYRVEGLPIHEAVRAICEQEPDWSGVDPRLRAVLRKGLAKDVAPRYSDAAELAQDLRRYLANEKTAAERMTKPASRRRLALIATAALPIALAAVWYRSLSPAAYTVKLDHIPGRQSSPSLSPNGEHLAFKWNHNEQAGIAVADISGLNPRWLTRNPRDCCPAWSTDGHTIGVVRNTADDEYDLMLIQADGRGERKLTPLAGVSIAWDRDSTHIAIAHRMNREEPFAIFLVDAATGRLRRLTSPPAGYYGDIAVASTFDGGWVLARYRSPGNGILMLSDEHGALRQLTAQPTWAIGPAVNQDQAEVLVRASYDGRGGIWRIPLSGNGTNKLLPSITGWDDQPSLSRPEPGRLAKLAVQYRPWDWNIWELRLDQPDATPRPLLDSVTGEETPAFSWDGRRIVFKNDMNEGSQIWTANVDGSHAMALTRLGGNGARAPRFSPDGSAIAFVATVASRSSVYTAPVKGGASRPRRLTSDAVEEGLPVWSPDGKWIYFRSMQSGSFEIWRAAADGTAREQITHDGASQGLLSHDGNTLYFVRTHDGAPVLRMPAAGGSAEELPDSPRVRAEMWAVGADAIWFVDANRPALMRYDLLTAKTQHVHDLPPVQFLGLDLARDGSRIVWSQQDAGDSHLAIVHNFR